MESFFLSTILAVIIGKLSKIKKKMNTFEQKKWLQACRYFWTCFTYNNPKISNSCDLIYKDTLHTSTGILLSILPYRNPYLFFKHSHWNHVKTTPNIQKQITVNLNVWALHFFLKVKKWQIFKSNLCSLHRYFQWFTIPKVKNEF